MGKNTHKCNAPGCTKLAIDESETGFCADHKSRLDPVSALYVDKTPEQLKADEQTEEFFAWLIQNRTVEELLG